MKRIIKTMEEKYKLPSLELVETVFTEHSDAEEGKADRSRNKKEAVALATAFFIR